MPKIYTASYFEPHNHHGRTIAISRSIPKSFKPDDALLYLAPSAQLLADYKCGMTWDEYVDRYREEFRAIVSRFCQWIELQNEVVTLLCWERSGEPCHRNLVAKFIQSKYPDRFGGCDVRRLKVGDRINVFDYTPANPSQSEARQWVRDRMNGVWWKPRLDEPHVKHRLWGDWETFVVGLDGDRVLVGSPEFPEGFTVDVAIEFCEFAGEAPQKPVEKSKKSNTPRSTLDRASRGIKPLAESISDSGMNAGREDDAVQTILLAV